MNLRQLRLEDDLERNRSGRVAHRSGCERNASEGVPRAGAKMCKLLYRSPLVNPSSKGGDHPKSLDVIGKNSGWSPGQPQFTFYRVAKRKEERNNTPQYKENSPFGGDRLTTPGSVVPLYVGFRWSPHSGGGVTTPDRLSGEVTL